MPRLKYQRFYYQASSSLSYWLRLWLQYTFLFQYLLLIRSVFEEMLFSIAIIFIRCIELLRSRVFLCASNSITHIVFSLIALLCVILSAYELA